MSSHQVNNINYIIDHNDWFKSEPVWRGDSSFQSTIINFLDDDRLSLLQKGVFGKFMQLNDLNPSGMLLHCMLLSEVSCNKKGVMGFCVQGNYVEFTLDIFGLVTGLPTKSSKTVLAAIREKEKLGSHLLNTYFDGKGSLKMKDLKCFMETRKHEVQTDADAVKLAELYILGRVLLGGRDEKVIGAKHIMLLEDEHLCEQFGWGELSFDETLNSLKNALKTNSHPTSYQLVGFPYAFMVWAWDILPKYRKSNIEIVSVESCPLMLCYRSCNNPHYKTVVKLFEPGKKSKSSVLKAFTLEHELPNEEDSDDKRFDVINKRLDKLQRTSTKKFKEILNEHKYLKSELAEIKKLLLGKAKSDEDLNEMTLVGYGSSPLSPHPQFDNVLPHGDISGESNVGDTIPAERVDEAMGPEQCDNVGKLAEDEEAQFDGVDRDNIICHGAFTPEKSAKTKILEESEHADRQNVSNIGVNDVVGEGMDVRGALGQHNSGSRGIFKGTKHYDNVDSIIMGVVSTLSAPPANLPTTPAVKCSQDEQSCDEQPNTNLDGSPLKVKAYTRKRKCTTPVIALNIPYEDDELAKTNMTEIGLSRSSATEVRVKDFTPKKFVRQKFTGKLVKSPYVTDFDSGASKCIFDAKHPFTCDIDKFDSMSSLTQEFWAFIYDGLNKSKRAKTLYREGKNRLPQCFIFGSCYVDTKDWFESLAHCNRPLMDTHLDVIFYYLRKKAKYTPTGLVRFTSTDFFFNNKLSDLYAEFEKNGKDLSVIPKEHEIEEYVRGFYCNVNVAWHKVEHVLFPIYVQRGKAKVGHWILGVFSFSDWCIHVYDSNRTAVNDKIVKKVMLPYTKLIPYFLERSNFYVDKGIAKSQSDDLQIKMVDNLPQQSNCDCGVFVAAFAEYFIHGRKIPKDLDIDLVRMRYATLLWDYGRKKQEADAMSKTSEKAGRYFGKRKRECQKK